MDFLKNLVINLKATGPAAVVCVWLICMTILGLSSNPTASWRSGLWWFLDW
jgi:hypothetical protein